MFNVTLHFQLFFVTSSAAMELRFLWNLLGTMHCNFRFEKAAYGYRVWKYVQSFGCFSNWQLALNDLDSLLLLEPLHADARYYRGRVRAELRQWNGALEDLSAAIHLNPDNAQAFHHRGCLLLKCVFLAVRALRYHGPYTHPRSTLYVNNN